MDISYPERVSRLNKFIGTGRLIRHKYRTVDADGREMACLLAALAPEVIDMKMPSRCPGDVMPQWLAHLTPLIDDAGTGGAWDGTIRRYAKLAGDWHLLSQDTWDRLAIRACGISLGECQEMTPPMLWAAIDERWSLEGTEAALDTEQVADLHQRVMAEIGVSKQRSPGVPALPVPPSQRFARNTLGLLTYPINALLDGLGIENLWRTTKGCHILSGQKESVDRMTNLLFDAIQKEIDAALAEIG